MFPKAINMKKLINISVNTFLITTIISIQLLFSAIFGLRYFISQNSIYNLIDKVEVKDVIDETGISLNKLYEVTSALRISREDTEKIINSNAVKQYLSQYIYENIISLKKGNRIINIEIKDIKNILISCKKENISISDETILALDGNKKDLQKYIDIIPNKLNDNITDRTIEIISFVLGARLFLFYFIFLILLFLISSLFKWSLYKPLLNIGIIISSASFSLILLSLYMIKVSLDDYNIFYNNFITFNLFGIFLGLLLLNLYFIVKKIFNK